MRSLNDVLFQRHLEDDESVHLVVHKHWLLGVHDLFLPIVCFASAFGLFWFGVAVQVPFFIYGMALLSIAALVWCLRNFFNYYLDAWIVTDQGIIDVAWHGWFHRQSSRVLYSDIQGVSYEIKGVAGTLLRYGTVGVEKISTGSSISMENVPRPRTVEAEILKNMETYLHATNLKDAKRIQELLSSVVARELQLHEFSTSEDDEQ